jgi:hypothetical protein
LELIPWGKQSEKVHSIINFWLLANFVDSSIAIKGTFGKVKLAHHIYTVDKIHAPVVAREVIIT